MSTLQLHKVVNSMFETKFAASQDASCATTRTHCCRSWLGLMPDVVAPVLLVTTGRWPTTSTTC